MSPCDLTKVSESWKLTTHVQRKLNNRVSKMPSIITGRSVAEEPCAPSANILLNMRDRYMPALPRVQDLFHVPFPPRAPFTEHLLPNAQAEFRQIRGCRGSTCLLAWTVDWLLEEGRTATITYYRLQGQPSTPSVMIFSCHHYAATYIPTNMYGWYR